MVILYNKNSENIGTQKLFKDIQNRKKLSSNCIVYKLTLENKKFLQSIGLKVLS